MAAPRTVFTKRFWLALGLTMVLAGFGTATAGVLGAREAKQRGVGAGGGEVVVRGLSPSCARQADASVSFAAATTASVVMPNSRNRVL